MFEEYLKKALSEEKLPNTLLFSGPEMQGKKTALWLASQLLKREHVEAHPDFHLIAPEGKSGLHSIDSLRNAIDVSHSAPYSAPAKVFLIESAESMQPAAANALLKTLEEPVLDSYWILLSERQQEILPTIVSRCARLSFQTNDVQPETPEFQEAVGLLRSLLHEKPTYPKLFLTLERIGELMEEKDPTPLFTALVYALRDLEYKNEISRWQEAFEQARLGVERNIKLATCLEYFFLSI
jgi:DNA polymerase III delta prime subunit